MLAREKILMNTSRVVQLFNALYVAMRRYSMLLYLCTTNLNLFFTFRYMTFFHIFERMNFRKRSNFRFIYAPNEILFFHFVLRTCSTCTYKRWNNCKSSKHMKRAIILSIAFRIVREKSTESKLFQYSIPQSLYTMMSIEQVLCNRMRIIITLYLKMYTRTFC